MDTKLINQTQNIDEDFLDFAQEIEESWEENQKRLTYKELMAIYPEAKEILPEKISEAREERCQLVHQIKKELREIKKISSEAGKIFRREFLKADEGSSLVRLDDYIDWANHLLHINDHKVNSSDSITDDQIERAKAYPIENLLSDRIRFRRSGKTLTGLCPLHEEKTPSFTVYPENNSFYCFGCSQGGDVISLVRQLQDFSFKEAVKYLAN